MTRKAISRERVSHGARAAKPPTNKARARASSLRAQELEMFREILLRKRRDIVGDVESLRQERTGMAAAASARASSAAPTHPADQASDLWEQEFTLGIVEDKRALLREVDDALARIDRGTYGICEATGRPITKARLQAIPWTRYCIEHAAKSEAGRY